MFRRRHIHSRSPATTLVRHRPSLDFSVTGVAYIAMMLFMGLAAINSQANLLFGVFGLMIGILLVSGVISRLVLRRLRVRRVLPDHACVGHPAHITYELTNEKRFWPSLSVALAELDGVEGFTRQPQCYMLHAAPRMTASVPALVIPKRRGLHELNRYQLGTSFPFGFIKRAITARHRDVMLVYPSLAEVDRKLLAMCRSADTTGETMRPRPGGADEFYGVRDYRPGDNPRWIYWRRSARSGELVTKEMTQVAPPRILLLVDTCLGHRSLDEHGLVEESIAMAASLAVATLEQGLAVGLCAWGRGWMTIAPTRGKRHRDDLLSMLARLPLNTSQPLAELIDRSQQGLHASTTRVLFTPREIPLGQENGRSGMLAVPAASDRAKAWFRFDPSVDFFACMPADQQPRGKGMKPEVRSREPEAGSREPRAGSQTPQRTSRQMTGVPSG